MKLLNEIIRADFFLILRSDLEHVVELRPQRHQTLLGVVVQVDHAVVAVRSLGRNHQRFSVADRNRNHHRTGSRRFPTAASSGSGSDVNGTSRERNEGLVRLGGSHDGPVQRRSRVELRSDEGKTAGSGLVLGVGRSLHRCLAASSASEWCGLCWIENDFLFCCQQLRRLNLNKENLILGIVQYY